MLKSCFLGLPVSNNFTAAPSPSPHILPEKIAARTERHWLNGGIPPALIGKRLYRRFWRRRKTHRFELDSTRRCVNSERRVLPSGLERRGIFLINDNSTELTSCIQSKRFKVGRYYTMTFNWLFDSVSNKAKINIIYSTSITIFFVLFVAKPQQPLFLYHRNHKLVGAQKLLL